MNCTHCSVCEQWGEPLWKALGLLSRSPFLTNNMSSHISLSFPKSYSQNWHDNPSSSYVVPLWRDFALPLPWRFFRKGKYKLPSPQLQHPVSDEQWAVCHEPRKYLTRVVVRKLPTSWNHHWNECNLLSKWDTFTLFRITQGSHYMLNCIAKALPSLYYDSMVASSCFQVCTAKLENINICRKKCSYSTP